MIYEYRCRTCGRRRESQLHDDIHPCVCGGLSKRDYASVQIGATAFQPHYNHSVGTFVNNSRDFDDALKRRAEQNTAATGALHEYTRIDPCDMEAVRPTTQTEAFETRAKAVHDAIPK